MTKLSIKDKFIYANEIEKQLDKIKRNLSENLYIPILQVAYRFKINEDDKDPIYVEYPYSDKIELQNRDLLDENTSIYNIDNVFFKHLIDAEETGTNYVLYEFIENNGKKDIIRIESSVNLTDNVKEVFRKGFSIIYYGAKQKGKYDEDVKIIHDYDKTKNTETIMFIVDRFDIEVNIVKSRISLPPTIAYMTSTFQLNSTDKIDHAINKIEPLVFILKSYGETILNIRRWEESEKEQLRYEIIKENTDRIESHRHTIFNLINAFSFQLDDLPEQFNLLKNGSKFVFSITKDICSRQEDRDTAWDKFESKPEEILHLLYEYFSSNKLSRLKPDFHLGESTFMLNPLERYSYFTIMYNFIHNAQKSERYDSYNGDKTYTVNSYQENDNYITEIITPAIMTEELTDFINNLNNLDFFDFENSSLKPRGGIAISKKLAIRNNWNLNVKNNHLENKNTLITTITIKMNNNGEN
jgi:hypothetical protein